MILDAKYTSTGILIVIPANGNGTFHAELGKLLELKFIRIIFVSALKRYTCTFNYAGDIFAIGKGIMSSTYRNGQEYFKLDRLDIDLDIKDVKMHVRKIFNNNRILGEYLTSGYLRVLIRLTVY